MGKTDSVAAIAFHVTRLCPVYPCSHLREHLPVARFSDPWKREDGSRGNFHDPLNIQPVIYIPPYHTFEPRLERASQCSRCRIAGFVWLWKLMRTGERATPREHRLARSSPCRMCVSRLPTQLASPRNPCSLRSTVPLSSFVARAAGSFGVVAF